MKLEIRKYGDPVLREKAELVEKVDDRIRELAKNMIETVRGDNGGVGLAAQQVGETVAVCVIEVPVEYDADDKGVRFNPDVKMPLVLINPEILEASKETEVRDEGCLSFPDIYAPVRRPVEIKLEFVDLNGKTQNLHLKNFVARVVQHEMDHLHGVLLVDRMGNLKKIALAGQLKRLRNETREELGVV
jgi:peptide deformylase